MRHGLSQATMTALSASLRALARDPAFREHCRQDRPLRRALLTGAKRYIAGESVEDLLSLVKRYERRGYRTSVEYMGGEDTTERSRCERNVREIERFIDRLAGRGFLPRVCFDLSTIGLALDGELCLANLEQIATTAAARSMEVVLSMEESAKTEAILDLYERAAPRHPNVGITLQARLHRTAQDAERVAMLPGAVRVVKGVYDESESIALPQGPALEDRFVRLVAWLVTRDKQVLVGTHDDRLIARLRPGWEPDRMTLECLHGVAPEAVASARAAGLPCCLYLVYGPEWVTHYLHRVAERPAGFLQALADICGGPAVDHPY